MNLLIPEHIYRGRIYKENAFVKEAKAWIEDNSRREHYMFFVSSFLERAKYGKNEPDNIPLGSQVVVYGSKRDITWLFILSEGVRVAYRIELNANGAKCLKRDKFPFGGVLVHNEREQRCLNKCKAFLELAGR